MGGDTFSDEFVLGTDYRSALLSLRNWFPEKEGLYTPAHFGRGNEMLEGKIELLHPIEWTVAGRSSNLQSHTV
jgi:hypothetical protein